MPRIPIRNDWEDEDFNQFLGFESTHTMSDEKPRVGDPKMGPIGFVHFPDHDPPQRKRRRVTGKPRSRKR